MKKVVLIVAVLVVLGGLGAAAYFWMQGEAVHAFASTPYGQGTVVVDVQASGPLALGKLLAEEKVVSDAELFAKFIRREKLMPQMKKGEYEFTLPLTPQQVAEKIASGQVKVYRFTVPEGLRVDEIIPILATSDLKLNADKLKQLTDDAGFLKKANVPAARIEGFLYPDTYTFQKGATEEQVLTKMVQSALDAYKRADAKRQPGVKLNLLETMTLASIVEKETGAAEERPRISCVFHNRLRLNMKLQTDPTVLYAAMLMRGGVFVKNITRKDLEAPHPYNTYTTKGLPPGPIANPGYKAIEAALNPIKCDDLFFVSRNDGTHVFCPDLKCHEGWVDKYQRRRGGRDAGDASRPDTDEHERAQRQRGG